MNFRTIIDIPHYDFEINHHDKIMMIGSCFAQNIGGYLQKSKFDINLNPYGVLYNPASIAQSINRLIDNKSFSEKELFAHKGLYQSFWHHGQFADTDPDECLCKINEAFTKANNDLISCSYLIITFGTSYVFELNEEGKIVGNCHKVPASSFNRYRLDINTIVSDWDKLIKRLEQVNPKLRIIFTVSPIRHLKDGLHQNQLSKATLLLAIEELCKNHPDCHYFPAYEILLDDLRDYRFYSEDMTHPNNVAVQYIWEEFCKAFFGQTTMSIIKEWSRIQAAIEHRPLNSESEEYKQFLNQTFENLSKFQEKYPYICCTDEFLLLEARRQALQ